MISREVSRNSGLKGYGHKQAQELAYQRAEASRNVPRIPEATLQVAAYFLRQDRIPEQVDCLVPVRHETLSHSIYADKAQGGTLWRRFLHCQKRTGSPMAVDVTDGGSFLNVSKVMTLPYYWKEFADHARIVAELDLTGYFADPLSTWQLMSNRNRNGLFRHYIASKRTSSTVTDEELKMIVDKLNFRTIKRLRLKTPHQVSHESLIRLALRP